MSEAELTAMDEEFGGEKGVASETGSLTPRQRWVLVAFAISFAVMIVSFVPWSSFGVSFFDAGQKTEEVVTKVKDDDLVSAYADKGLGTLRLDGNVSGTVATNSVVTPAWSALLTGASLGNWYFNECTTWFLLMAFVIAAIGGLSAG